VAADPVLLVCDMINDLVHAHGPNGKSGYGPELARRNMLANTVTATRSSSPKAAAARCPKRSIGQ
jgi:hypothetical protein